MTPLSLARARSGPRLGHDALYQSPRVEHLDAQGSGTPGSLTEEPRDSDILSPTLSDGESEEAGVDGMHAETRYYPECEGVKWSAVVGRRRSTCLIFKTVADPTFILL